MITYFFIFLAVLAVASALMMVISKNTVNSALFLVLNMMSLAGLFLLLQAQFLAIIQVLVYAGAIMVLFLFVIMLLNVDEETSLFSKLRVKYFVAFLLGVGVFAQILYSLGSFSDTLPTISSEMAQAGTVEAIGDVLFSKYILPFHIIAMLLTAAMNGAIMIAQHKVRTEGNK
ncbi:NADH-quinone oxidoreductase subunit J family protein [Fodinibius halophilus]|uniref:NADH-quinone oxidoreductase subunit J n=1 Tax=Fodinibius halophilus TaxID=1736908 RepID=A0A6M1SW15_9BACT|nr:NADH-quinone oxidoreductase subunit J [Fodinibius halophilus]NGP87766.1 NADH-quinone oxidoreductase subunit J [Fodinibius halophilus]